MEILNLILPIFGVLLTGTVFGHLKILPEHTADILVQFAFQVAIPALLILAIAQEEVDRLFDLPYIAALGGSILLLYILILLGALYWKNEKLGAATMLANQYGQRVEPVADTISVTTIVSIATMFLWLMALSHLFPAVFHGAQ